MEDVIQASSVAVTEAKPTATGGEKGADKPCIIIVGGTCVNDDHIFQADVIIQDGLISDIGPNLTVPEGAIVLEAKGKLVIPGGIDLNTHFQLPFMGTTSCDDFYSGTKSALAGGTTMIVDCVWDNSGVSPLEAYEKWRDWADSKIACDYSLSVGITWWNEQVANDMEVLVNEKGVNIFRVSQEYKHSYMLDDGELLHVFKKSKQLGALTTTLAENGHVIDKKGKDLIELGITGPEGHAMCRTEEIEAEATQRAIVLANQARCPVCVVPVTSKTSARLISDFRRKGHIVFGAPVTASIGTDGTHYWNKCWRHASAYVMVPPLRPDPTTPGYLVDLLSNGDLQFLSSAHCTFNADQKAIGKDDFRNIPHGVNGVEERMSIIWDKGVHSGRMDPCRFVSATSTTAAKILNIYPQKGRLAPGSDGDVVIWDPEAIRTVSTKTQTQACDFNIYEGAELHGMPIIVISNGKIVLDQDGLKAEQGAGRYIPNPPNSVYVYGRVGARDQALAPQKVDRDPYDGEVAPVGVHSKGDGDKPTSGIHEEIVVPSQAIDQFHRRPPTRAGGRNLQESSFSFSGDQFDDSRNNRTTSRVINPPGGRSGGLW